MPFCHFTLKASKPLPKGYPHELKTVGDHIRKKRLDLKLFQKDVAKIIGVETPCVYHWETNLVKPTVVNIPKIVEFLGYSPYEDTSETLAQKILTFRRKHGLKLETLAKLAGINKSTLIDWKRGHVKHPQKALLEKLEAFFKAYSSGTFL